MKRLPKNKATRHVRLAGPALMSGLVLFVVSLLTQALPAASPTGWVKLETGRTYNTYSVRSGIGTYGGFTAGNVREGASATDPQIPDGEYWVTFWVEGSTGRTGVKEVEHKKKMKFVGGKMSGFINLTVALGKVTSAGVSYPP